MTTQGKKNHLKGAKTEELLAAYFRKMGYYVMRGVDYSYADSTVTDIDLWIYMKSSSMSREISIVDIKDKRQPQAFERILWTKGLQLSIGADKAIVATTDNKEAVSSFGKKNDVTVLNGLFLKKLDKVVSIDDRLTEEDLEQALKEQTFGKIDGDWKGRLKECQSAVCGGISFNSINFLMDQANYFARQSIERPQLKSLSLRIFYRILSMICISIDYQTKELVFLDKQSRYNILKNGFTYGSGGSETVNKSINQGLQLIEEFGGVKDFKPSVLKMKVQNAFFEINADIIAEYFSNITILQELFTCAFNIDNMSMMKEDPNSFDGNREVRSLIGCLLDFWGIDRSAFGLVKVD